jgi:hypothetical protein
MNYPLVIRIWYWIVALFSLTFGFPFLSVLLMEKIANAIGDCSFVGSGCFWGVIDLSSRFEPYGIMFVSLILTPISFVLAFWDILLLWAVVLWALKYSQKQQRMILEQNRKPEDS